MADTINIEKRCGQCLTVYTLTVSGEGFRVWNMGQGAYVQDAFPELDAGQRELLVSGICGSCFDALVPPEDDPMWEQFADPDALGTPGPGDTEAAPDVEARPEAPCSPVANPGASGATHAMTDTGVPFDRLGQWITFAVNGLTRDGDPATRGHLRAPRLDWPRCSREIPGIDSPIFLTAPNICNRPATVLASFTDEYLLDVHGHRCGDPDCPIMDMARNPEAMRQAREYRIPVCGMHIASLRRDAEQFRREVRPEIGEIFLLVAIGVEVAQGATGEVIELGFRQ
jgi:hypothetical protein